MGNELEALKKKNVELEKAKESLVKEIGEVKKDKEKLEKENASLITAQQELKAKIKQLSSTDQPKITSGHKPGSVKYVRQERVKKKTE